MTAKLFIVNTESTRMAVEEYFKLQKKYMETGAEAVLHSATALFSDNADFDIAGNIDRVPWIGPREGPREIANFFRELKKHARPIHFEVRSIVAEGDKAVALGKLETLVKETGKIINSEFAFEFIVQKGLIARFRLFEDSFAVSEATYEA